MRYLETIKIVDGTICNMDYHVKRLYHTIGRYHDLSTVVPDEFTVGIVKYRILYDETAILESSFSHYKIPNIESLMVVKCDDIDYSFKYANRHVIEQLMLTKSGCDDVLIVRNGMVTDTSFCNVVFADFSGLYTPTAPLLKGTKRTALIENGIIKEREIKVCEIGNYDKIILINAMIDLYDVEILTSKIFSLT